MRRCTDCPIGGQQQRPCRHAGAAVARAAVLSLGVVATAGVVIHAMRRQLQPYWEAMAARARHGGRARPALVVMRFALPLATSQAAAAAAAGTPVQLAEAATPAAMCEGYPTASDTCSGSDDAARCSQGGSGGEGRPDDDGDRCSDGYVHDASSAEAEAAPAAGSAASMAPEACYRDASDAAGVGATPSAAVHAEHGLAGARAGKAICSSVGASRSAQAGLPGRSGSRERDLVIYMLPRGPSVSGRDENVCAGQALRDLLGPIRRKAAAPPPPPSVGQQQTLREQQLEQQQQHHRRWPQADLPLPVLGLDTEWQPETAPGVHSPVVVVQLSGPDTCLLLQPQHAVGGLPPCVRSVLEDPGAAIKVGLAVHEDCRRLMRDCGVAVKGVLDVRLLLQHYEPEVLRGGGGGLQSLARSVLGVQLDKTLQRSDWGAGELSDEQVQYAATDAWVARELLVAAWRQHLAKQRQGQGQQQHVPLHAAANGTWTEEVASDYETAAATASDRWAEEFLRFVGPFIDTFRQHRNKVKEVRGADPALQGRGGDICAANGDPVCRHGPAAQWPRQQPPKPPRPSATQARKSELYENCRIVAPDGTVLCTCSRKKVVWYLDRNLADIVSTGPAEPPPGQLPDSGEDGGGPLAGSNSTGGDGGLTSDGGAAVATAPVGPCSGGGSGNGDGDGSGCSGSAVVAAIEGPITIRLRFEPQGRGHADDSYYLSDKANRCCVCGREGEYLRHSVVPHCYRQYFPAHMKSHLSHDIVLLCVPCHQLCNQLDQRRMAQLAEQYGAPVGGAGGARVGQDERLARVRSAGRALLGSKDRIPLERRVALEAVLRDHFGCDVVSEELVTAAAAVDPTKENSSWRSHAELVVEQLHCDTAVIEAFVRGWRQHFLACMRPRFMPPCWSVDSRVANSAAHTMPEELAGSATTRAQTASL